MQFDGLLTTDVISVETSTWDVESFVEELATMLVSFKELHVEFASTVGCFAVAVDISTGETVFAVADDEVSSGALDWVVICCLGFLFRPNPGALVPVRQPSIVESLIDSVWLSFWWDNSIFDPISVDSIPGWS